MPASSFPRARLLARLALLAATALPVAAPAQVPDRLADSTFWRMMREFSEPGGWFRSENLVSNETSMQWVIPRLAQRVAPGGVYLGVAPDQNFTYVVALRPAIAFIVDIRHQNAMQHLMYKALIELSATRAEFLARLFARPPLAGVDTASTADELFDAVEASPPPDSARFHANLQAIVDHLVRTKGFPLSDEERSSLGCVYGAFVAVGPELTYGHGSECGTGTPQWRMMGSRWPTYRGMTTETDSAGTNWSYLGSEARYRVLRAMQQRNLIVPLTGNFAGPKALRAVGDWARARRVPVTAFYVSNVEQYLFQQGDEAPRFYANVATLPLDSTSTFIRSFSGGRFMFDTAFALRPQSPRGRSMQLTSGIQETLRAFAGGEVATWLDVVRISRQ